MSFGLQFQLEGSSTARTVLLFFFLQLYIRVIMQIAVLCDYGGTVE